MALPANINYGTVSGVFLRAKADGTDVDRNPDGEPIRGLKVTFTPSINPALVKNVTAVPPVTILIDPVACTTDDDGVLCGPDGSPDVLLVASGDTDLDPSGWTWTVEIKQTSTFPRVSFAFVVGVDSVTDLSTVLPVPAGLGADLILWQQAVADTLANKVAAQTAATDANTAKLAAEAVPTTTDGLLTTIDANPASTYRVQADARQNATIDGKVSTSESGETARLSGVFTLPHRNTAVLLGTSLESQGNGGPDTLDPVDSTAINGRGWFTWANAYMGQRFKLLANAGIGGNTSAQMLARIQADVVAFNPDWVFIGGPANDPSSDIDPAVTITNYTAILDALVGRQVVMLNHPPRVEINTTARRAAVATINEWVRLLPQTRKNVIVVDVWRSLADPATGAPATGMATDGTHYTEAGAQRVGARVAAVVGPLSTPRPRRVLGVMDPRNCIGNPAFTGGTGWATLGTSGLTISYAADPESWATKAVLDIAAVADEAERGIRYLENISSARFAPGDVIQATARFVWSNLVPISTSRFCHPFLRLMTRNVDGTYARQDILGFFVPSAAWAVPAGVPTSGDLVAATFRFTMPAGVDRLYVDLGWQGAASMHLEVSDLAVSKLA